MAVCEVEDGLIKKISMNVYEWTVLAANVDAELRTYEFPSAISPIVRAEDSDPEGDPPPSDLAGHFPIFSTGTGRA
jgi:hypothetical protein